LAYGYYALNRWAKEREIRAPERTLLMFDGMSSNTWRWSSWNNDTNTGFNPNGFMYQRHEGHFNAIMWDLHVEQIRPRMIGRRREKLRKDLYPILWAPHALVNRDRSLRYINPANYP
jgi:hypothetical protein